MPAFAGMTGLSGSRSANAPSRRARSTAAGKANRAKLDHRCPEAFSSLKKSGVRPSVGELLILLHAFSSALMAGAAPPAGDFGFISDPPDTNLAAAGVGFAVYALIAFVVPFHAGRIVAARFEKWEFRNGRAGLSGLAASGLVWFCAIAALRNPYELNGLLAWSAGTGILVASLSLASGIRSRLTGPDSMLAYADVALGLASVGLFMGVGFPMALMLAFALAATIALDFGGPASHILPSWWKRGRVAFAAGALPATLLLLFSGPSWIGW